MVLKKKTLGLPAFLTLSHINKTKIPLTILCNVVNKTHSCLMEVNNLIKLVCSFPYL